jgi:hypothetical protein
MDERLYSQASCVSEPYRVLFSRPDKLRAGSQRPCWVSVDTTTKWAVKRAASRATPLIAPLCATSPEAPEQAERDETSRFPMSTSPQPKPTNGYPHDKSLRIPSRHPRPDSPLPAFTVNGNSPDVKSASPGSATRFGWQFPPRNRPQLPDFEPDTSLPERSPSSVHRPTSRTVGSGIPSHIPVRSPGQVPKVVIK